MNNYQYHTLANGLRIVFRRSASIVAYSGVYINVGSRNEVGEEEGMAHFIEHSIFKGTEHRRAFHILNRIDGVGGELNAFTTKEETCIYATSLTQHLARCLELFSDVLFHSVFPQKEIEKEKDVVLEEINSYKDSPADLIYDEFEELVFEGHPLSHNILGSKKNVRRFTPDCLRAFMRRNYTPDRMVVTVVADVDFAYLIKLCERYFSAVPDSRPQQSQSEPPVFHTFNKTLARRTHQVHALIGCEAPNLFDEKKVAFALINNILGGPAMNSRLNVAVREKYGFCYTIESQYSPFFDTGLFYIYAGIEGHSHQQATEVIMQQLRSFCTTRLSDRQLLSAQRQLVCQTAINNDSGLNEMQSIGKAFLNYDHVETLEEMTSDIMALSADDLIAVANEYFDPSRFSFLYYC